MQIYSKYIQMNFEIQKIWWVTNQCIVNKNDE